MVDEENELNWKDVFDEDDLKASIQNAFHEVQSGEFGIEGDEDYLYYLDELSSGASGTHQPSETMSALGVDPEEMMDDDELKAMEEAGGEFDDWEFAWDLVEDVTDGLADGMNADLSDYLAQFGATLSFEHTEGGGDYCLAVSFDKATVDGEKDGEVLDAEEVEEAEA